MTKDEIMQALQRLNEKLKAQENNGELFLYGGAVMCLCLNARLETKDVDGIFSPKKAFQEAIAEIALEQSLPENWLNDAVKGFVSQNNKVEPYETYSNLTIYTAEPRYLLAMKCLSCRLEEEEHDVEDIQFLIHYLQLTSQEEVEEIILEYFPPELILPKVSFLLGEMDYCERETKDKTPQEQND